MLPEGATPLVPLTMHGVQGGTAVCCVRCGQCWAGTKEDAACDCDWFVHHMFPKEKTGDETKDPVLLVAGELCRLPRPGRRGDLMVHPDNSVAKAFFLGFPG